MSIEEQMDFLTKLMSNGKIQIKQFFWDNHGTLNVYNNDEPNEKTKTKPMPTCDQMATAILKVQDLFWGNCSYSVLYCVLRDCFSYKETRTDYEKKILMLPYKVMPKYTCTPGVVSSTFSDNKYMELNIDKWEQNKVPLRVLKLVDGFKNALNEVMFKE